MFPKLHHAITLQTIGFIHAEGYEAIEDAFIYTYIINLQGIKIAKNELSNFAIQLIWLRVEIFII